ncbi:hypothetical protein DEU56DRAFT_919610 [Suillus clintonianus]|uniref:uncharacterized protein n=1 Tax=Suillus clintonianus TaxID=1904413 RepID=UPI001B880750|nr:uncharacterized protein DEU56DRAFT_919610 [Suillus clintonianus]KAG2114401.1 hypothetical protein DEU56DRAFT_919610 [Suillus clintonianus]
MSTRPSIISSASFADDRRTLPAMPTSHPQLHKLKRCTSLEWVYDAHDHSDDVDNHCCLIIRVGDDVTIFPLHERSVPIEDGSLPIMSYWYGKVNQIYLKANKKRQWYYRQLDLEDEGVDLAACVGEYELVLSDHKTRRRPRDAVAMDVIPHSPLQRTPSDTAGHAIWWFNDACIAASGEKVVQRTKAGLPSIYDAVEFDDEFLALLTTPIRRGGLLGIVSDGGCYISAHTSPVGTGDEAG